MMLRAVGVTLVCLIILATTTSTQQVRRRKKTTLAGKVTPTPHQAGGSTPAAGGTCGQGKYLDLLFVVGYPTVVNTEDYEEQEDSYENEDEYRSDDVSTVPPPGPPPDWKHILDFCASLVNSTRNEFTKTRVGMVTFQKTAQVVFGLNANEGIDNIVKAINAVKEEQNGNGFIDLNDALGLVPSTLRPHNDTVCMANSANVAIIITDAEDNVPAKDTPLTLNHATTAKSLGIKLWMVPVTHIHDKINYPRWEQIVSDKHNDIFNVSSFLTIDSVLPAIESRLKSVPTGGATAAPPEPTHHSGTPGSHVTHKKEATKKTHRPPKTKATKETKATKKTHKTHKPGPGPRTTPLKLHTTQHQPQPTGPTAQSPAPAPGTTPKPHNGTRDIALTCNNTVIDVALVIDMSATLPHRKYLVTEAWNTTAAFLKKLIDASDISETASHVAIVTYFDKADVAYYLYENQTKAAVTKAIDSINFHHDAHTDLVGALRLLQSDVFNGVFSASRNVSRRALIIAHSDDDVPEPESKMLDHTFTILLASLDVRMYAIAVGKGIHGDRLKDLTLRPEKDFFSVPDPAGLDALVPAVAANFFCIRNKSKEAESESDYESDEDDEEEEEEADVEEYDEEADDEEKSDERELKLTVFTGCEQRTGTRGKVTATIFDSAYRGDFELQLPSGQYFDPGSVHTFTVSVPNKLDDPQISFKPEKTTGRGWHLWKAVLVDEEEDDHYVLKCDCKIKGQSEQEPQPLKRVAAKRVDKILTETCDKKD